MAQKTVVEWDIDNDRPMFGPDSQAERDKRAQKVAKRKAVRRKRR